MRVAIVAGPGWAPTGGVSPDRRVADQAAALAHSGQDVSVYVPADPTHPTHGSLPMVTVPAGKGADLNADAESFGAALADHWQRWRPDLVHAHYCWGGLAALTAARASIAPLVLTFHHGDGQRDALTGPPAGGWHRRLGYAVDRVVAQTRAETDALVRLGVPRPRITVVPPGADTALFTPGGGRATGPEGTPRAMVTVGDGRPDQWRGVADTVQALRLVPAGELVVVPHGAAPAPRDRQRLQQLAARCGVAGRVHLADPVSNGDLPASYRAADVVVCPSRTETLDTCAVEAMACGVPVVATTTGAHRDAVVDGLTGLLVPPGNPAALARALRTVLGDPIRRMAYAAAARDRAQQCYAWDRVVRFLTGLYQQLRPAEPEPRWPEEPGAAQPATRTASA